MVDTDQESKLQQEHERTIWCRFICFFIAIWLVIVPFTFSYYMKNQPIFWSDIISGIMVFLLTFATFSYRYWWGPYALTLVGIWLQFAPIAFWAPEAVMYLNDTLIGSLAIAFSLLIPGAPGESMYTGPEIPKSWSYNPSSWSQRIPIIFLAMVCWFASRYMASYQLGYLDVVVDPAFGNTGTRCVITSSLSRSFPIPDAGLGALAYTIEFLLGFKGGTRRWYSMPWIVLLFAIMVIPVGIISIILITCQPILVGHWCFWCLLTALSMLIMISLTVDEAVAGLQFLWQTHKSDKSLWKVFWKGGEPDGATEDTRSPKMSKEYGKIIPSMFWGMNVPWNLVITAALGGWLMASPYVLNIAGIAIGADSDYITGAVVVVISIICMGEIIRSLRYINILLGIWLIVSVWVLWIDNSVHRQWSNIGVGILLIILSFPKGRIREKYGSLDRWIF